MAWWVLCGVLCCGYINGRNDRVCLKNGCWKIVVFGFEFWGCGEVLVYTMVMKYKMVIVMKPRATSVRSAHLFFFSFFVVLGQAKIGFVCDAVGCCQNVWWTTGWKYSAGLTMKEYRGFSAVKSRNGCFVEGSSLRVDSTKKIPHVSCNQRNSISICQIYLLLVKHEHKTTNFCSSLITHFHQPLQIEYINTINQQTTPSSTKDTSYAHIYR